MLQILESYLNIIQSYRITKFEQFGSLFKFRAEINFIDNSKLYIRETVIGNLKRKYSYHWQNKNGILIIRWDNAPDWNVVTFPHHKHIGSDNNVSSSYERTLPQVLETIANKIKP